MPTEVNQGFNNRSPFPLDHKYSKNGVPYANAAEVLATIPAAYRHDGLTVLIGEFEYHFFGGTTDAHLKRKNDARTILLDNVDGSYVLPAGVLCFCIAAKANGIVPAFKFGNAAGAEDIQAAIDLPANQTQTFNQAIFADANRTIYFGGIAGTNKQVTITLYLR